MENPDQKVLDQALKMHKEGRKLKEILELTELNYSQAWLYITDAELPESQRVKSKDANALKVRQLRDHGHSWGMISVMFGYKAYPEGKIRKMFEEASGVLSVGLRIAKGGRYLSGDPVLYQEERRKVGIELPRGTKRSDLHDISAALRSGKAVKASAATKKAAAKRAGAVKSGAAKPKKAVAKKAVALKAKPVEEPDESVDPFGDDD